MASPYLVYVASKIIDPSLDEAQYSKWYQEHHIPDIIKSGSLYRAAWYRSVHKESEMQWLAVYKCHDFEFMTVPEKLNAIPKSHALLGEGNMVWDVASFDMRHYELQSAHEASKLGQGESSFQPATFLVVITFESTKAKFLEIPGHRQSQVYAMHETSKNQHIPKYVVLHEFDNDDTTIVGEELESDLKRSLQNKSGMTAVDVKVYRLVNSVL